MAGYRLSGLLWAVVLAVVGIALLLFNFGVVQVAQTPFRTIAAIVLAVAGVGAFVAYLTGRANWWRLIPAWALLALGGMVYLTTITMNAALSGSVLFIGLALAFWHIYVVNRAAHWWALMPGGFLLVIGAAYAFSQTLPPLWLGSLLFGGSGLVFCLVYLLSGERRHWWALVPGIILLVCALVALTSADDGGNPLLRWWPLLLILAGIVWGVRTSRQAPTEKLTINTAPGLRVDRRVVPPVTTSQRGVLGEYSQPAPGASVEVLNDE